MGLYLCIFDADDELDGVDVGSYRDFNDFRSAVVQHAEQRKGGSRCPTLILHSDCDGTWTPQECAKLEAELTEVAAVFQRLPVRPFESGWQKEVADSLGLHPVSLYESFIDVDGEPLIRRLRDLAKLAQERRCPILFQ
jgi:Immunity protein 70